MDLKDKTIIITGVARIGQTVAKMLKDKGARLVVTYLHSIEEAKPWGFPIQADVSKKDAVANVIGVTLNKFGSIDGLIHMAAIYQKTPWSALDEDAFEKNINVIAKSAFLFGKMAGDQMLKNKGEIKGKMIFFSDWSVLTRPYQDHLAYNAAKSTVVGLTKSFAKELAPHILVNAIAPGPILKPHDLTEEENAEVIAGTLLGRWGGTEEIAKGVSYLLEADFVTGHVLTIDGGRTIA